MEHAGDSLFLVRPKRPPFIKRAVPLSDFQKKKVAFWFSGIDPRRRSRQCFHDEDSHRRGSEEAVGERSPAEPVVRANAITPPFSVCSRRSSRGSPLTLGKEGWHVQSDLNRQLGDAIYHYDHEAIKRLLAAGADFNVVDPEEGTTPFSEALYHGLSRDCVSDVLQMGANPDVASTKGGTPLIFAVWQLDFPLLQALLEAGAKPNTLGYTDDTPMTALDAVADDCHTRRTAPEQLVLEAMELLLKSQGAKFYCDLTEKPSSKKLSEAKE
jgi:hypothetical protein